MRCAVRIRPTASALLLAACGFGDIVDSQLDSRAPDVVGSGFEQVGAPAKGSTDEGENFVFEVPLETGASYKLVGVCDASCSDVDLVLENSAGTVLDSDYLLDDIPLVQLTPSTSDSYRVVVAMASCSSDPCGWGVAVYRSGDALTTATSGVKGSEGRLAPGDLQLRDGEYYDIYEVEAFPGQRIVTDLTSSDFDTYLVLTAPGGTKTQNDDYQGDTSHSRIEHVAVEGGTYELWVTSYSSEETGAYDLDITIDGVIPAEDDARIESGTLDKSDETLTSGEFTDTYTVEGVRGEWLVLDLRSDDFDTYLILTAPSGTSEYNDDFEGDVSRSVISTELSEDGEYLIGVTSYHADEEGAYTLRIQSSPDMTSTASGPRLERGELAVGDDTLRSGEYADIYAFRGTPGQQFNVDLTSDVFDTYVIVRGPGDERQENDDTDRPGHSVVSMDLSESGEYRVIVTSYEPGETGAYQLSIDHEGGSEVRREGRDVVAIEAGQSVTGRLERGDARLENNEFRDNYVFDGVAGETVTVEMNSSDFDTYLGVIQPSGDDIQNDDWEGSTRTSRVDLTLRETGRYRIFATSYAADETGAYELSLRRSTAPAPSVAGARNGAPVGGRVLGIFVGISDYPGQENDLAYTADDARHMAEALVDGAGMQPGDHRVLTDAEATLGNVESAIREIGGRAGPDDLFVLFYSGHGNRVPRGSFQATDPDGQDETLVFYDEELADDNLDSLLADISPGVSLLLLDACFSGGFSKDVISRPGRMGLFSSEEDVTSSVAAKFRAGGYLAHFLADAIGEGLADADGDGQLTALELSQYVHERYRTDVKGGGPEEIVRTGGPQLGYQHLVVDRGSIAADDVLFR